MNLIFGTHGASSVQIFMNRILVLGKDGMLGTMVSKYFTSLNEYEVYLTSRRDDFKVFNDNVRKFDVSKDSLEILINEINPDFLINCIGIIKPEINEDNNDTKIYNNSSGVIYCIDKAIKDKKRILIDYHSDFNNESTYREISPIKKFKLKSRNYLQAYCHLRKAERNFLTKSIKTATEMDKKRTSVRLSKPNVNFILNEDEELDDIELNE